jgi:hypothetical protein
MSKKLFAACLVIAAFSVMPSLASAKPVITHPTGTVLATGTKLLGTNIGDTIMVIPGSGEVRCSTAHMTGNLHVNSTASGFEGEITSATFAGTGALQAGEPDKECTGFLSPAVTVPATSLPWCLEGTKAADTFELRGGKCTEAAKAITFQLIGTIFGFPVACKYSRAAGSPVVGSFTTHETGDAVATVTGEPVFKRTESPESCPAEGKLKMAFTVETDVTPAAPLYISS